MDRAVRFYYLLHFSFGALMKNFIISPSKAPPRVLNNIGETVRAARSRLINTIIENRDFETLINSYDRATTFFYLDPPYYGLTDYKSQGSQVFRKEDQVRLRDKLAQIKGKFLLSINDHPDIRELYADFNQEEVGVRYSVCRTDKSTASKELLISNYELPDGKVIS